MSFKEFIKAELTGWRKVETIGLSVVFLIILVNAFVMKDSIVAVVSAICGILYSTIAGKGKVSCYFFGLMGTCCYSWLSFENALWGNLVLYMCYYFPMQVLGIFEWRKHLKSETKEIYKKRLSNSQRLKMSALAFLFCVFAVWLINLFKGSNPLFDGITTVLSVFGMYFTVKRCIEQWIAWVIVNGLSTLMWLNLVFQGTKAYATLIMWFVYFLLAIYFYIYWKKEISAK